jgi:hypothetical protein
MPGKLKLTAEWRRSSTVHSESTPQSGKGALLDGLSCSGHKAEDLLYKGSLRQHVTPGHGTHLSLGQHRHCPACRKVFPRSVCERLALCRTCRVSTMDSFLIAWQPKHTTRRWAGLRSRRARPRPEKLCDRSLPAACAIWVRRAQKIPSHCPKFLLLRCEVPAWSSGLPTAGPLMRSEAVMIGAATLYRGDNSRKAGCCSTCTGLAPASTS